MLESFDMPLESPVVGSASNLYKSAASKLGISDVSSLALFAGSAAISHSGDLSCAPLADGVVLSAYVAHTMQLSSSVLSRGSTSAASSQGSGRSGSGAGGNPVPFSSLACLSSDTIAEVRERAVGALAAARVEPADLLRGSLVFAVDLAQWNAVEDSCSLGSLRRLLGHFTPCRDSGRLSRLGITEGCVHLVFVPNQHLMVSVEVRFERTTLGERRFRVTPSLQLTELRRMLDQDLRAHPFEENPGLELLHCHWSVPTDTPAATAAAPAETETAGSAVSSILSAAMEVVSNTKRRSFGSVPAGSPSQKKPRFSRGSSFGSAPSLTELSEEDFLGDLQAQHPVGPQEPPGHFRCPIRLEVCGRRVRSSVGALPAPAPRLVLPWRRRHGASGIRHRRKRWR